MIGRYFTSILGAFAITFSLFFGMNYLIKADFARKPEIKQIIPFDIGHIKELETPLPKIMEPPEPEAPIVKLDFPRELITNPKNPIGIRTDHVIIPKPSNPFGKLPIGMADGDILPIAKYLPEYPRGLLIKGVEGYVVVKFTVNKMGAVEHAVIVESTNNAFNGPSLKAVGRYKYKPRLINGIAIEVNDILEKLSFELDKNS